MTTMVMDLDQIDVARGALERAFWWSTAPGGAEYWADVMQRLRDIKLAEAARVKAEGEAAARCKAAGVTEDDLTPGAVVYCYDKPRTVVHQRRDNKTFCLFIGERGCVMGQCEWKDRAEFANSGPNVVNGVRLPLYTREPQKAADDNADF